MKALIFSDLHAHNYEEFSVIEDGINSRFNEQLIVLALIKEESKRRKTDCVIYGGDITQLKNYIDSQVIDLTLEALSKIADICPLIICPGNHDYKGWGDNPHMANLLGKLGSNVAIEDVVISNWKLRVFPYRRDVESLNEELAKITRDEKAIGIFHQDLIGNFYGGMQVQRGIKPALLSGLFKYSFVGHYHEARAYLVGPKVVSIGSPLQLNFGEVGQNKGYWFLDTEATQPIVFIKNSFSPIFRDMTVTAKTPPPSDEEALRRDYFRIKVEGGEAPEWVQKLRWKRISYEGRGEAKERRLAVSTSDKTEDVVRKYIEAKAESLDKAKLFEAGMRYLQ